MTELEFMSIFGGNLASLMRELGWSQNELSDATGISQGTISKYVNGRQMPSLKAVLNITCTLECDINELIYVYDKIEY